MDNERFSLKLHKKAAEKIELIKKTIELEVNSYAGQVSHRYSKHESKKMVGITTGDSAMHLGSSEPRSIIVHPSRRFNPTVHLMLVNDS